MSPLPNDEDVAALNETTAIWAPHSADYVKLQMAAVICLHSLSRSVQLLRTSFQDYPVWKPLMMILSIPATNAGSGEVYPTQFYLVLSFCKALPVHIISTPIKTLGFGSNKRPSQTGSKHD